MNKPKKKVYRVSILYRCSTGAGDLDYRETYEQVELTAVSRYQAHAKAKKHVLNYSEKAKQFLSGAKFSKLSWCWRGVDGWQIQSWPYTVIIYRVILASHVNVSHIEWDERYREDKATLTKLCNKLRTLTKKQGIDLKVIEIKDTIYFFPQLPARD